MRFKSIVFLTVFLLKISSVRLQNTCPPPNYPSGGSFSPKKLSYRFGDRVTYTCEAHLTLFGSKENVCSQTKWIQPVPFCDSSTKLRYPSFTRKMLDKSFAGKATDLIDKNPETCIASVQEIKVYLENPAPVHTVMLFLKKGGVNLEIKASGRQQQFLCSKYERYIEADQWVTIDCLHPNQTEFLTVQDIHGNPNKLTICEIQAFVEDSLWCRNPPRRTIANGVLEISRGLAVLHCGEGYNVSSNDRLVCEKGIWEGSELVCREVLCENSINPDNIAIGVWVEFKEKHLTPGAKRQLICPPRYHVEGEPSIATCLKTGNWTKTNAICVVNPPEKGSSSKIIGIAVGVIGAIVIVFLMGLTVYLLRRRGSREVVVVYKPESNISPPVQESEYSTIYYGTQTGSFSPMTPPPPPPLTPKINPAYTKPYDERTPVDLAFGTLKTSTLYDALND